MVASTFEIRYGRVGWVLGIVGLGRRRSEIALSDEALDVRMGWAFGAHVPFSSVRSVTRHEGTVWSIGVHTNFRGAWLVNGAGSGIVWLEIDPPTAARSLFGTTVRRLGLSLEDPQRFVLAMTEVMGARER